MNTHQAYEALELDASATQNEIKGAYRKMALESHPDKSGVGDDLKFKRVTEAYHLLKKQKDGKNGADTKRGAGPRTKWGAPPGPKSPEEDWGRFTREFEEGNPGFWAEYEKKFWEEYDTAMKGGARRDDFEKTREPKHQPDLSVEVDPTLCIGCCSCETIAPEVFEVDKMSKTNPKSKVINEKGAKYNRIVSAAETCPTKAIIVENRDTNERIYPF